MAAEGKRLPTIKWATERLHHSAKDAKPGPGPSQTGQPVDSGGFICRGDGKAPHVRLARRRRERKAASAECGRRGTRPPDVPAAAIRVNLSAVAKLDPHAAEKGYYRIRSLYFDDPLDTALHEKLDGVNERRKFRIRYYNDDLNYMMLECKMKRDGVGTKPQEPLSPEEAHRILQGDIAWLAASRRPLLTALYVDMKVRRLAPKTVVEYKRIPFIYGPGNVRVTIDWGIRTGLPETFMQPDGLTLPIEDDVTLLEVKWDEYLPGVIRQAAALKSRSPTAFSKYAACRVYQ